MLPVLDAKPGSVYRAVSGFFRRLGRFLHRVFDEDHDEPFLHHIVDEVRDELRIRQRLLRT